MKCAMLGACARGWLVLFDESLLVLACKTFDSPPLLLGYDGSGPPTWTAALDCLGSDATLLSGTFTRDRRLWMRADQGSGQGVLVVEF
jgi:hypothetical protein